jgi:hypothetical protein
MMSDFATRFAEAKSSEESCEIVGDVLKGSFDGGAVSQICALIAVACEMAVRDSVRHRMEVAAFLRTSALSVEAGVPINHQPTTKGNIIPLKGAGPQ